MNKYDVIIIGAGPSGIFCAYELMRQKPDMKVLMIEKGRSIEKRQCPKSTTKVCVGCKPCSITTGFAGAGAFSDGKLSLSPDVGGNLVVATNVSSGKNANGVFVGQKVGRDQYKYEALQWKFLDAATWSAMMQEFDKFVVTARIPDMVNNRFQTIRMYPGNRTATPVEFNGSGLPTKYRDCKVNIIDCGVIE